MASSINASTSGAGGVITTADNTGILNIQTAGTTAVTVDASQNVGIGTTSPTVKLDVNGTSAKLTNNASADVTVTIGPDTATASRSARLGFLASNAYKNWYIGSSWNTSGGLEFTQTTTTGGTTMASTPSMMIDSSGSLLVGTTSAFVALSANLQGSGSLGQLGLRNSGATAGKYWQIGPNASNNIICYNNSSVGVYIVDGGTSWTGTSDERLKTDLKPIENAAEKVSTLRAVTGRFIADEENKSRAFLIAQDVQKVLPEAVDASDPEKLGIAYTDVIPLLVAAIKEQQALITSLTARITALEGASL